jgi:hypothetical protein
MHRAASTPERQQMKAVAAQEGRFCKLGGKKKAGLLTGSDQESLQAESAGFHARSHDFQTLLTKLGACVGDSLWSNCG